MTTSIIIPSNLRVLTLAQLFGWMEQIKQVQHELHGYPKDAHAIKALAKIRTEVRRRVINYYDNHHQSKDR